MASYRHLPVWKAVIDLAVHLEKTVRRFPRYHKYGLGLEAPPIAVMLQTSSSLPTSTRRGVS
jgi:hypothetical protein